MMPLAFAAPWALAALSVLPLLWWLLKVTPPPPRLVRFPAIRLLFGLVGREDSAARTPLWVLVLRMVLAVLIILAVAHPLINPGTPIRPGGPLVVAVDDGWASARDWPARRLWLEETLARAERARRPVLLLRTAPPADGAPLALPDPMPAADARAAAQAIEPRPWATDRAGATRLVNKLPRDTMQALWLADGLDDGAATDFARALQALGGGLEIVTGQTGRVLLPPAEDAAGNLTVPVRRLANTTQPERLAVRAVDAAGRVLGREEASLAPNQAEAQVALRLPNELRNRLARLDIEAEAGAASTLLLDESWRRRPVGLAGAGDEGNAPLLGQLYYVDRALAPVADLRRGEVSELLARELSVLVLADVPALLGTTGDKVAEWVEQGGVLLRFAGPALAQAASQGGEADPLLPVRLRDGGRSLGGVLSWTTPQGLAPFPASGPFAGLTVPADVSVRSQVLAEPTLDLAARAWASLEDGTPLVTGARKGKGWVVLVHTSANADWSNLPLSGLFPAMLRRLVTLADGTAAASASGPLPPVDVLDGFGRLTAPGGAATAISGRIEEVKPGPRHPPGLYGDAGAKVALNLGPAIGKPGVLAAPSGAALSVLGKDAREIDLRPALLSLATLLLIVDLAVALMLRGLLRKTAAAIVALVSMIPPARAADSFALEATLATRLAYVRTGDSAVDRISQAGLAALSRVVGDRSTAALAAPMGIDLDRDPVLFFPLLYWPVTSSQQPLAPAAVEKLNAYMRMGGLVVLDVPGGGEDTLRALAGGLAVPPLGPLDEQHVLTRSFYLLKEMPGRFDAGPVWVEAGQGGGNDGVSPVVLGANDWAGAWATDERGRPLFATVPGGERQREMAYRFGINLVMYALTGNYKADQVHLPAILERLGR